MIEIDSLLSVKEIQEKESSRSMMYNIIKDVKKLMRKFPNCSIQHVRRICNGAAHRLARFAWNVEDIIVWWESFPDFIHQVIWTDNQL